MASVGAARVVQNTHWTELILIYEKLYFDIFFGIKKSMLEFEPTACRFVRFYKQVSGKVGVPLFFQK